MEREVRYCTTSDGVRIAYSVEGEGYPLLWCPLFVESFSLVDEVAIYRTLIAELAKRWTLVRYDPRGVGLSEREAADHSNSALVRDISAVVTAAGLDKLAIWANIISGPRAVTYAVQNPARVTHLVLYDTFADPEGLPRNTAKAIAEMARTNWQFATTVLADMGTRDSDARKLVADYNSELAVLYQRSSSGHTAADLLMEAYESWDVRAILPEVRCPTLIMHHVHNPIFPIDTARQLAAGIPGAILATIEGARSTPAADLAMGTNVVPRLEKFLPVESAVVDGRADSAFRAVLFTDLVGHTEMMSRLGDERGRAVLREHERITREVLKANGGTEVKTMGDGFMASFGSVTKAVECAVALQRAFTEREGEPLNVRVGLNAGEPIEEDGDLFGATVILASRIAAKANGGEILVADTVRGLCSGKGFLFADRGEFVAKGFEEPVRAYEVSWR